MARVTLAEGVDGEHGGVFAERHEEGRLDDDKHWWMQAEAVVGFLNAFESRARTRFSTPRSGRGPSSSAS